MDCCHSALTRELTSDYFNELVSHPLQSYEWGVFNEKQGLEVVRDRNGRLQLLIQRDKKTGLGFGYVPKGRRPSCESIKTIKELGHQHECFVVKIEPNVTWPYPLSEQNLEDKRQIEKTIIEAGGRLTARSLFSATFIVDLQPDEALLKKNLHQKVRYNIGVAQRHGVKIRSSQKESDFKGFVEMFVRHVNPRLSDKCRYSADYLLNFWNVFESTKSINVLKAEMADQVLAYVVLLRFKDKMYYPYGVYSGERKFAMAPTLLMWEAVRLGKQMGCREFDLWGAQDCSQIPSKMVQSSNGVHKFLSGFGGQWRKAMDAWSLLPEHGRT